MLGERRPSAWVVTAICNSALLFSPAPSLAVGLARQATHIPAGQAQAAASPVAAPQSSAVPPAAPAKRKVCQITPETAPPPSAAIAAALKLFREEKFDDAIRAYNSIVPIGGSEAAAAYAGLARVYIQQNNPTDAYEAAMKAVALTPNRAPAIVALGEVYFRQGKIAEAEAAFLKPLAACDLDARAFLGLYNVYAASVNWKHAKTNIDQAYRLDDSDPEIVYYYAQTLSVPDRIRALQARLDDGDANYDDNTKEEMKKWLGSLKTQENQSGACRITSKLTSTETELEPLLDQPGNVRGYGLTVKINGASARLMLDTGAGGIAIDRQLAEKAGVKQLYETKTGGIGDEHPVASYVGRADKIRIGNLEFENCQVDVLKERSIVGEDGLIGANVFRSFLIDINMPKHKMKLSELPPYPDEPVGELSLDADSAATKHWHDRYVPPEMKDYTPIFQFGHFLAIPTTVNSSPPKLFMIDTGAFDNQLSLATAKEVTKVSTDYDRYGEIKGISGKVKTVYTASRAVIQFANFKQDREDLFAFDLSHISDAAGVEISGLLGFRMLFEMDMKIDYRDGLIHFAADERFRANAIDVFGSR